MPEQSCQDPSTGMERSKNLSDGRMCNACLLHICWWTQCECNIAQPEIPEDDGKMTNTCWPEVVLVLRFYVFASQPSLATILWPKYPEISWVSSKIGAIFFVPKVVDLTKAWRPCQEAWTCGGNRLPCDPCDLPSVPLWVVPVNFGASFQGFLDTWKVPHRPLRLRGCPRNKDKKRLMDVVREAAWGPTSNMIWWKKNKR